ncbi:MAG: prepilin-type N-terminal cleavage/methylation domain-containing protein [Deltaproteobacteria bacterium]|nr:prepilin-type N-terminal cleavage/methylation domain-containing protein [Deltaproteobacteria bacterium]
MNRVLNRDGFTLVELMVAIAILSIGMAAIGTMLYSSYQANRYNAGLRRAEALAMQLCERFKAGNVGKTTDPNPCNEKLPESGKAVFVGSGSADKQCWDSTPSGTKGTYFCQWTTRTHASGQKELDLTVYWDGANCTYSSLSKCKRKLRMINYYKPSGS